MITRNIKADELQENVCITTYNGDGEFNSSHKIIEFIDYENSTDIVSAAIVVCKHDDDDVYRKCMDIDCLLNEYINCWENKTIEMPDHHIESKGVSIEDEFTSMFGGCP